MRPNASRSPRRVDSTRAAAIRRRTGFARTHPIRQARATQARARWYFHFRGRPLLLVCSRCSEMKRLKPVAEILGQHSVRRCITNATSAGITTAPLPAPSCRRPSLTTRLPGGLALWDGGKSGGDSWQLAPPGAHSGDPRQLCDCRVEFAPSRHTTQKKPRCRPEGCACARSKAGNKTRSDP